MKVSGHSGNQTFLIIQLSILFVSMSVFSIGLHSLSAAARLTQASLVQPAPAYTPVREAAANPAQAVQVPLDYQKVDDIVRQRIAELPKPKDGLPGMNGTSGLDGKQGDRGEKGQDGVGIPGREIELQSNPLNGNLEWRYAGDDSWQILMKKCAILSTCEAAP